MTKDRKMIAKGVPRNRYLVAMDDEKDKKRILTYQSEGRALAGFKTSWFWGSKDYTVDDLEAVQMKLTMEEVK